MLYGIHFHPLSLMDRTRAEKAASLENTIPRLYNNNEGEVGFPPVRHLRDG